MRTLTRREALRSSAMLLGAAGLPITVAAAESTASARPKLKVLVAGGHPDDPESGCGGTMALYADAGHEVVSLYLTRGEGGVAGKSNEEAAHIRTAEAEEACRILGARPLFAGQIDGATEVNNARYEEFRALIDAERPDVVLTHWPIDTHRDHRATALLVYEAWLAGGRRFALYYFEVLTGLQTQHFLPTNYVDITDYADRKKAATFAHASQNPEDGFYAHHEEMHRFRGKEAGMTLAEAFIRQNNHPCPLG